MWGSTSSGIYLNYGFVDWNIGEAAKGGIFLNFDKLERTWRMEPGEPEGAEIGERACGGVFVTKYLPERGFMLQANGAYGVGPEELASDKRLASLLDEIEHIGKILNIPKTKELAHRIDAHVRVNYRPRKIA
jgi:hypothetical protein